MTRLRAFTIYALLGLVGGLIYCALELLFRSRTHPSMLLAGGLCVLLLYVISIKSTAPAWKKWLVGGAVITTVEFITGAVVNILLGLKVWDYSAQKWDLMGQICPSFSLLWILLSIPVIWLLKIVDKRVIGSFLIKGDT